MTNHPQDSGKLWAVHAGPYHNPNEIYPYLSLPFCTYLPTKTAAAATDDVVSRILREATKSDSESSWELLIDDAVESATFNCTTPSLTETQAALFSKAVADRWFYEWYYDDLPVWGMVGEMHRQLSKIDDTNGAMVWQLQSELYTKRRLQIQYMAETKNPEGTTAAEKPTIHDARVWKVDLISDSNSLQAIQAGQSYTFELEVKVEVGHPMVAGQFQHRFDRYLDHDFFDSPLHRWELYNSGVMVLYFAIFLGVFFCAICKYNRNPDNHKDGATIEDGKVPLLSASGSTENEPDAKSCCCQRKDPLDVWNKKHVWNKLNAKDVLVAPIKPMALAALVGNGWHIMVVMTLIVFGLFFTKTNSVQLGHGGVGRLFVQVDLATTVVAGFVSGYHYRQWMTTTTTDSDSTGDATNNNNNMNPPSEDTSWRSVMAATALLLPAIATPIVVAINAASLQMGTIGGFRMSTILHFLSLWAVTGLPGVLFGTLAGRWWHKKRADNNSNSTGDWLSRQQWNSLSLLLPTNKRVFKLEKGLRSCWWTMMVAGGIIPFGVVYIECYFVMTSLWDHKFYLVTEISVGVFVSWFLVTCGVAILVTMSYLNVNLLQDPHQKTSLPPKDWHWQAFRSVAAFGVSLFLYAIYFYRTRTQMTGLFQTTYFFGTMLFLSIVVSLAAGAVGHSAASQIIRLLYSTLEKAA